jgi:hypothetical protein
MALPLSSELPRTEAVDRLVIRELLDPTPRPMTPLAAMISNETASPPLSDDAGRQSRGS